MRRWRRILGWTALVAAAAAAGIALNLSLLGRTQDTGEPVGRLSPRAVFTPSAAGATAETPQTGATVPAQDADRDGDDD